jgi:FKBP-type peptidyl-prolyl cis-trans isomerase SlyD
MKISPNSVVNLTYTLRENDPAGEIVEKVEKDHPAVFLIGVGALLEDFETNLKGLQAGDSFSFGIEAASAYGELDPHAVVELPISTFVVDGKLLTELLEVGKVVPMSDESGRPLNGTVISFDDKKVVLDFNHPLAGKNLHFSGEILSVRQASAEELDHGHVHGDGGHHH